MSESFPDEGDKVEVISGALMLYDRPRAAGTHLRAGRRRGGGRERERKHICPLKGVCSLVFRVRSVFKELQNVFWGEEKNHLGSYCLRL